MKYNKRLDLLDVYTPSSRFQENIEIKLDWNESTIFPSKKTLKQIQNYIKKINFFEYPDINAAELKKNLELYLKINKKNIEIFNGSDDALNIIFETFLDEEKSVLYFSPTYNQIKTLIGSKTNKIFSRDILNPVKTHEYDFCNLENYNVVYIVNPNNPTGYLLDVGEIQELLKKYPDTLFIVDEAYAEFSLISCKDLIKNYKNIIITRTFSKAFALASLRIGYILADEHIIEKINKLRNGKSVNSLGQKSASLCLQNLQDFEKHINKTNNIRDSFIKFIKKSNKFKCQNSKSNFVLIECSECNKFLNILKNNKILVRDFSKIKNLNNCVRITIGTKKEIDIIKKIIKEIDDDR